MGFSIRKPNGGPFLDPRKVNLSWVFGNPTGPPVLEVRIIFGNPLLFPAVYFSHGEPNLPLPTRGVRGRAAGRT